MNKKNIIVRENYQKNIEELGFNYHTIEGKAYWDESYFYFINKLELEEIKNASDSIYKMYLNACDYIINKDLFEEIGITNNKLKNLIKKSWENKDFYLYGRFDFSFDGENLKLLEYNAQTPTSLLEASIIQHEWATNKDKDKCNQFNDIHRNLVNRWENYKEILGDNTLYFCLFKNSKEDLGNVKYLEFCAKQAGIKTKLIDILDVFNGNGNNNIYDKEGNQINFMFHLIPYEFIIYNDFDFLEKNVHLIEPLWKIMMQSKGMLKIIYFLFPKSKYLLKTTSNENDFANKYVKKPFFSREGANVSIINGENSYETKGEYGKEGYVYQEYCKIPKIEDRFVNIGVWMIGEKVSGIGFRDDETEIIKDTAKFIPYLICEK